MNKIFERKFCFRKLCGGIRCLSYAHISGLESGVIPTTDGRNRPGKFAHVAPTGTPITAGRHEQSEPDTYAIVTKILLYQIGKEIGGRNRFALIYDRGPHSGDMVNAFNRVVADKSFPHAQCFVSFTSMASDSCVPLQAADLIAYENFKESCRHVNPRKRRKTLELLLDLGSFGGRARYMNKAYLSVLRDAGLRY